MDKNKREKDGPAREEKHGSKFMCHRTQCGVGRGKIGGMSCTVWNLSRTRLSIADKSNRQALPFRRKGGGQGFVAVSENPGHGVKYSPGKQCNKWGPLKWRKRKQKSPSGYESRGLGNREGGGKETFPWEPQAARLESWGLVQRGALIRVKGTPASLNGGGCHRRGNGRTRRVIRGIRSRNGGLRDGNSGIGARAMMRK